MVKVRSLLLLMLFIAPIARLIAADYTLTVTNGTGDGTVTEATTAQITADAPAVKYHFQNWSTADGGSFADIYSPKTTYTMPSNNANVTASFTNYSGLLTAFNTKLTASDAAASDEFGYAVAISGDTAVVGAQRDGDGGSQTGSAYVFIKSGGVWTQQAKLTASDAGALDNFGCSVSITGDTIVIGAAYDDTSAADAGSAYVFTRAAGVWTQRAKLAAADAAASDFFGKSVSISGNTILVGANGSGIGGAAYVFTGSGAVWAQQGKLTASDTAVEDDFGASVFLSGDTALIGAHADDDAGTSSGSAYVFTRSSGVWTQQAKLTATDAAAGDQFGYSVSLSGDTVVVGARYDDDLGISSGSAYIFSRSGTSWSQQAKLTASDGAANDQFGQSVVISNDTVVIGAVGDDDTADGSGSAFVFLRNGTTWSQQAKLTAPDAAANDAFGSSVAVMNTDAIIGAVYDAGGGSAYTYDFTPAFTLTVTNGSGDGLFLDTNVVPISADAPPTGYHFVNWTTADGGTIADSGSTLTTYTMPANDATVTANYAINTYTLTYTAGPNGSISGTTPQTVNYGSSGTKVTAVPATGYHFVDWSDGILTAARTDTNVDADITVTANFAINTYTLTYTAGTGGSITGTTPQTVNYGADGTQVTAVADDGYTFADWSDGILTAARTDTNITANLSVTANFDENPKHRLVVENGSGDGRYPEGKLVPIVAGPRPAGMIFDYWSTPDGGAFTDINNEVTTYTMPTNDATVTANYKPGYILTVNYGTGSGPYEPATVVNISADAPLPGLLFSHWSGDVANVADVNSTDTTITIVDADVEITATYAVDPATAVRMTYGSMLSTYASEVTGMDNEFTSRPTVYGQYTDPVSLREKSASMKGITAIGPTSQADISKSIWIRNIILYNKTDLKNANSAGTATSTWLAANPIGNLDCILSVKARTRTGTAIDTILRGALIVPPVITSIETWDGNNASGVGLHTQGILVIKGNYFGVKAPNVSLEYTDPATGKIKLQRLKVLKVMVYPDAYGKTENSYMDVDMTSGTYAASEIHVQMPRNWWTGWTAGNYDLVLDNKLGIDTASVTTADSAGTANPVANNDTYNLQAGDSSYLLDVLSNDQDADSDSLSIVPGSNASTLGGRVSVSGGKIRYSPPRGATAPIADTFTYSLEDGQGGVSGNATVTVNIAAIIISSVENWDGNALVSVQNGGLVVLKGQNFGVQAPSVLLHYTLGTLDKTIKLKVQKSPQYADYKGKANSSYTDLTTGNSEITVEMPQNWWVGWAAGDYTLEINNKFDSATTTITTTDLNSAPVANDDTETIFSGQSYYSLDVLANDSDAESDKVKIILDSAISAYGSRLTVDVKTNTVLYYRSRDILCDFNNDTFTYYLEDSSGNTSASATVTVSGSLNP